MDVRGPLDVTIDVTGKIPLDGAHHLAGWVFAPETPEPRMPILCCLPGGSYSKAYWHLEVAGRTGYSFGQHMAGLGMLVVALDHINVGESSRHPRAVDLTPDVVAAVNAVAFSEILQRTADGTLVGEMDALDPGPRVGVGHSMGAMLTIFQQSLHRSYDAIAPLGYGTVGPIIDPTPELGRGVHVPTYESVMELGRSGALDNSVAAERREVGMHHHFYWDDVPEDVIAADDLTNATLPGVTGPMSVVPFIASDHAGRIECPVFIGLGERDSTPSHYDEARAYSSSNDVTLFILERSAHCHNSASTREVLWNRLARWIRTLEDSTGED